VKLGLVRLLEDPEAFKNSFARFTGDNLNGWSEEKHKKVGKEGTVTKIYKDKTITMAFDDGAKHDFPFETVDLQLSLLQNVTCGRVKLVEDPEAFKNSFIRFIDDNLNGWSEEKQKRAGQEGYAALIYKDKTITVEFDDGARYDFPFETVDQQLSDTLEVKLGLVRLLEDPEAFKNSFARFTGDNLNGWSEEKQKKVGKEGTATKIFKDKTITMAFDDGAQYDFPFETVDLQLSLT